MPRGQRFEFEFDELVAIPWGVGEVLGHVQEIYGRPERRYVVVRLSPELSNYVVDEETTVVFPLEEVRRVEPSEAV